MIQVLNVLVPVHSLTSELRMIKPWIFMYGLLNPRNKIAFVVAILRAPDIVVPWDGMACNVSICVAMVLTELVSWC